VSPGTTLTEFVRLAEVRAQMIALSLSYRPPKCLDVPLAVVEAAASSAASWSSITLRGQSSTASLLNTTSFSIVSWEKSWWMC
jgi:hypothetical protein